jgi:protease-4
VGDGGWFAPPYPRVPRFDQRVRFPVDANSNCRNADSFRALSCVAIRRSLQHGDPRGRATDRNPSSMTASIPSDYLAERKILRRRLSFWRIAAFAALIAAVAIAGLRLAGTNAPTALTPHIARLAIKGTITGDREMLEVIKKLETSQAAAVLVTIESPGGTTAGAERVYDALRRLSAKKPTVAVVGTMAASGGYIAALGADQIVAQGNALLGSIGVIFQYPNFTKMLETVGVTFEDVKSSPLKAVPNGLEPTSPEARAALAKLVEDSYAWFKALVKERRALSDPELATVSDGRVFSGRQSVELRLADRLGEERDAIEWLEREKNIAKSLPVRDWKPARNRLKWLGLMDSETILEALGLDEIARLLDESAKFGQGRMLDGLVSIWQVGGAN